MGNRPNFIACAVYTNSSAETEPGELDRLGRLVVATPPRCDGDRAHNAKATDTWQHVFFSLGHRVFKVHILLHVDGLIISSQPRWHERSWRGQPSTAAGGQGAARRKSKSLATGLATGDPAAHSDGRGSAGRATHPPRGPRVQDQYSFFFLAWRQTHQQQTPAGARGQGLARWRQHFAGLGCERGR